MSHSDTQSARKAAVLVSMLDVETADALLDRLPAELAARVRALAATQEPASPEERDQVLREFLHSGAESTASAGDQSAESFESQAEDSGVQLELSHSSPKSVKANDALPSTSVKAASSTHDPQAQPAARRPSFDFLSAAEPASLFPLLRDEHPQMIAVIVAHLPSDRAAHLLDALPEPQRDEVIRRVRNLGEADETVLREVEQAVARRFAHLGLSDHASPQGRAVLDGILAAAPPDVRQRLDPLINNRGLPAAPTVDSPTVPAASGAVQPGSRDDSPKRLPPAVAEPPGPMTFDDIQRMDGEMLFTVFAAVTPEEAILALFDAAETFVERVLAQLSSREARLWRYALANPGPTRLSDVADAQERIAAAAERLVASGQINPNSKRMALVA